MSHSMYSDSSKRVWRARGGKWLWLCCTMTREAEADAANYNHPFTNYTLLVLTTLQHNYLVLSAG